MTKTYVIDTNVILEDPYIINKLEGDILVPTTVLLELDTKKFGTSEKNRNAREFARLVDKQQPNISFPESEEFDGNNDRKILEIARLARKDGKDVTVVTNDIYMTILARDTYKISTQRGTKKSNLSDEAYSGIAMLKSIEELEARSGISTYKPKYPNKYYVCNNGIFRHIDKDNMKRLPKDRRIWGIKHKNAEQKCALDALLDDSIKLVTLSGRAGTGKTLLAIAAGLEKVISDNEYQKLLVSRPVVAMGNDIGYLPGDITEKLAPWMQPIFDNIDFLFNVKGKKSGDSWLKLEEEGLLKLEALTYIRGRSIPNQYIIIDEAQNLSKHEIKTIISRAGENTKIVLTGDPDQIDNPKLDSINNGLAYVIERFKTEKIAAHIHFTKCERSELATIATEIL